MAQHLIVCAGPHPDDAPVLGYVDLPDDATPADVARATSGALCGGGDEAGSCGDLYNTAVALDIRPAGHTPDDQQAADIATALDVDQVPD